MEQELKKIPTRKSCEGNESSQKSDDTVGKQIQQIQAQNENKADPVMSKNQLKKLKKYQKYLEKKMTRKDRRKEAKERKRLEAEKRKQNINHESDVAWSSRKRIKLMSSEDALPLRVTIDLSFEDLMNERDITKLVKQVQRSYATNRRAAHPLQLYLTSFGGEFEKKLAAAGPGYKNWDVHLKTEDLNNVFSKDEVIYLTSDSPNVLNMIDMSKVLVIGGLVDHNHHKGLCYELALKQGFGHAQLPIGEYIKLNTRKVLTVNQVYEILVHYTETNDWRTAFFNVIPPRKLSSGKCLESSPKNSEIIDENKQQDDSSYTNDDENKLEDNSLVKDGESKLEDNTLVNNDESKLEDNTLVDDESKLEDNTLVNDNESKLEDNTLVNDGESKLEDNTLVNDDESKLEDNTLVNDDESKLKDNTLVGC